MHIYTAFKKGYLPNSISFFGIKMSKCAYLMDIRTTVPVCKVDF